MEFRRRIDGESTKMCPLGTVCVAIMQLEASATLMQVKVSAANMWVTILIEIIQVEVCCNHAGGIFYSACCA